MCRLTGSFKHHGLLRQRLLQIIRRKAQTIERHSNRFPCRRRGVSGQQIARKVSGIVATTDARADPDNRHDISGFIFLSHRGAVAKSRFQCFFQRFNNQVGIIATKAKSANPHPLWPGPGLSLTQQTERRSSQGCIRLFSIKRRRLLTMFHRRDCLDQPGDTSRSNQVTKIGFERTDRHIRTASKDPRHAAQFRCIADRRTGGVTFQQTDISRGQPGLFVGRTQGPLLPLFRRGKQTTTAPVI